MNNVAPAFAWAAFALVSVAVILPFFAVASLVERVTSRSASHRDWYRY